MCNGWKNRETWLVNLWFGDTLAAMQDDGDNISADYIETLVNRHGFIMDMMDLGAIDYDELASHYAPEHADAE
jgi:hypothetical protein